MDLRLDDIFQKNSSWFTYAQEGNYKKIEEWVKNNKIYIDFPDHEGNSALYFAVKNGHLHVIHFLVGEGANFYQNFDKISPWDIAKGQVKYYLETLDPRPNVKTIESLINEKALEISCKDHKEVAKFIFSVPEKYQTMFLKDYLPELVFNDPDQVLDFINRIEDEEFKVEMLMQTISTALSCGDVELATSLKEVIPQRYITYPRFEIRAFTICFEILENEKLRKVIYPDGKFSFEQVIKEGLKRLGLSYSRLFEESGEKIILEMIKTSSFKKAIEYANSLNNPEKAFARRGLTYCCLEELLVLAKELGEKAADNYFERKNDGYLDDLEKAIQENNIEAIKRYFPDQK